jgi:hypothetical protein
MTLVTFDSVKETQFYKGNANVETWIGKNETLDTEVSELTDKDHKEASKHCFGLHTEPFDDESSDFKSFDCDTLMNVGCEIKTKVIKADDSNARETSYGQELLIRLKVHEVGTWSKYKTENCYRKKQPNFSNFSNKSQEQNVLRVL